MNEFFDLNSEESIRKVANGEFARSKRKYAYRATFKLGGKFCNESESLNLEESSTDISMGNQCRINIIIRVPRWFKAVMQEDEIFRMNERHP